MTNAAIRGLLGILIFTSGMAALSAFAGTSFEFTFSGSHETGSGTLIANDNGDGTWIVTSGTGQETYNGVDDHFTVESSNATGDCTSGFHASTLNLYCFDNLLIDNADTSIDGGGLLLFTDTGYEINLMGFLNGTFGQAAGSYLYSRSSNKNNYFTERMSFSLSEVPEPGMLPLFMLGLLTSTCAGAAVRRHKQPKV